MRQALFSSSAVALVALLVPALCFSEGFGFPDRKAIVLDSSPHVKINSFSFGNGIRRGTLDWENSFVYEWTNVSVQPVIAFELVTLKYDPFDKPMRGSLFLVPGRKASDFRSLEPGETNGDRITSYGLTHTLTAIAYIRTVRLKDGTVWRADPSVVAAEVKKAVPYIKDAGPLVPEPEKKERNGRQEVRNIGTVAHVRTVFGLISQLSGPLVRIRSPRPITASVWLQDRPEKTGMQPPQKSGAMIFLGYLLSVCTGLWRGW